MDPLNVPLPSSASSSSSASSLSSAAASSSSWTSYNPRILASSNESVYGSPTSPRSTLASGSAVYSSVGSQQGFSNDDSSVQSRAVGETAPESPPNAAPSEHSSKSSAASAKKVYSSYPAEELDSNFKSQYPPDPFGDEASDTARVWKVYRDEAVGNDSMLLDGWNKTLDILLIFSGLFSAVSTAFIIESYKTLQPDYTQYLADTVFDVLSTRNGSGALDFGRLTLRSPFKSTYSQASYWINGLWFTSLVMSLTVALLCILAKQWLDEYNKRVLAPVQSTRHWVRRHAFLYEGLEKWGLPAFISALPVMLHFSLFLFLVGLVVFLWTLSEAIAIWLLLLTGGLFAFYAGSTLIPFKYPECPTATPLLHQMRMLWALLYQLAMPVISRISGGYLALRARIHPASKGPNSDDDSFLPENRRDDSSEASNSMPVKGHIENQIASRRSEELDATALYWLISSSPAPDVVAVGIQAIGGFVPRSGVIQRLHSRHTSRLILEHIASYYSAHANLQSDNLTRWNKQHIGPANIARYLRSAIVLAALDEPSKRSWLGELGRLRVQTRPIVYDLPLLAQILELESKYWKHFSQNAGDGFVRLLWDIKALNRAEAKGTGERHQPYHNASVLACLDWFPNVQFMIHLFHAQRMHKLPMKDLVLVTKRTRQLVGRDAALDTLAEDYPAAICLELWSGIVNSRDKLALDDEDIRLVFEDFNLLTSRVSGDVSEQPDSAGSAHFPEFLALVSSDIMTTRAWKHAELDNIIEVIDIITSSGDGGFWGAFRQLASILYRDFLKAERGYDSDSSDSASSRAGMTGRYVSDSARDMMRIADTAEDRLPSGHLFPSWEMLDKATIDAGVAKVRRVIAHTFRTRYVYIRVTEPQWDAQQSVRVSPHWHDPDTARGPVVLLRPDGAWKSWLNIAQGRVDLMDIEDAIATQLCCLYRRGFDVGALLDEFLDAEDHIETIGTLSKPGCKPKLRESFERVLRHCVEIRPEWWTRLRDEVLNEERDEDLSAYVNELDQKLHSWTPCTECLYVTDYHRTLLATEDSVDRPPPTVSQPPCGLNAAFFIP